MNKNGKNIKCKVCKKEFYISESRFNFKKYCSRKCGYEDNWGFKERKKKCIICENEFIIKSNIEVQKKTCSQKCWYENNKRISKKRTSAKKEKICKTCKKKFIGLTYILGTGKCQDCRYKELSKKRKGKNNPNYQGGLYLKKKRNTRQTSIHLSACQRYRKHFLKNHDYLFCEQCGVNKNGTMRFEVHHIYIASLYPSHKELHNFKNLILICLECHQNFHRGLFKKEFKKLEKERELKKLFS